MKIKLVTCLQPVIFFVFFTTVLVCTLCLHCLKQTLEWTAGPMWCQCYGNHRQWGDILPALWGKQFNGNPAIWSSHQRQSNVTSLVWSEAAAGLYLDSLKSSFLINSVIRGSVQRWSLFFPLISRMFIFNAQWWLYFYSKQQIMCDSVLH